MLSGKTVDTNTPFLAKQLFNYGIDLIRIIVIRDDRDEIAEQLKLLSSLVGEDGFVFTSGGIGPTHDDVTYEGVAKAFNRRIVLHEETKQRMLPFLAKRGVEFNAGRERMALVPENSSAIWTPGLWVPVIVTSNVHILPGIPSLFEKMLVSALSSESKFHGHSKVQRVELALDKGEGDFASDLTQLASEYVDVDIGSYPVDPGSHALTSAAQSVDFEKYKPKVVLTLQSRNETRLQEAVKAVQERIGGVLVEKKEDGANASKS